MGSHGGSGTSKTQGSAGGREPGRGGLGVLGAARRSAGASLTQPALPALGVTLIFTPRSFSVGVVNCPRNCHLTFHSYACIFMQRTMEGKERILRLISISLRSTPPFPPIENKRKQKQNT